MKHYFNFICWMLRNLWRGIITYPNDFLRFYKEALREETVMTLVFSVLGWIILIITSVFFAGTRVEGTTKISSDYGAAFFLFTLFFPPCWFVIVVVSMLHDKYCAELQGTMDRLKR